MQTRRYFITFYSAILLGFTPLSSSAQAEADNKPAVVASFSILGDFVRQIAGDRVRVDVLVGPDADAHAYSPTPSDAKRLAAAQMVVVNGLKFEGWIDRLVSTSKTKGRIVVASKGVQTIAAGRGHTGHDEGHGHGHDDPDPHAWQSIANARVYVRNIRDGLIAINPEGAKDYEANAKSYLERLDALEAETKAAIEAIPPARRKVITTHDAFGYFADAYGLRFIAPQGVSTDSAASAKDVAKIIRQIRREKIPAVFTENISDPRLSQRIAQETGAKLGGALYSDQLSPPEGPAGTYIDMVRHNIRELTKALAAD